MHIYLVIDSRIARINNKKGFKKQKIFKITFSLTVLMRDNFPEEFKQMTWTLYFPEKKLTYIFCHWILYAIYKC